MTATPVPGLSLIDRWPTPNASVAVVTRRDLTPAVVDSRGEIDRPYRLASVTKLLTAMAALVAVQEEAVHLDQAAGPEGSTVRHLLAHASGLGPNGEVLAPPGRRRIYSNAGFEVLARTVSDATGMRFADYLHEGVIDALGMEDTTLGGSPAHGATSTVRDLTRLAGELLAPRILDRSIRDRAVEVAFPGLAGVLPGFGPQAPNDWGLGFEIRGTKSPHWTATSNSPGTAGHFGRSGTFLWVDPAVGVALVCLTDLDFGPWAAEAWPVLGDAVLVDVRRER